MQKKIGGAEADGGMKAFDGYESLGDFCGSGVFCKRKCFSQNCTLSLNPTLRLPPNWRAEKRENFLLSQRGGGGEKRKSRSVTSHSQIRTQAGRLKLARGGDASGKRKKQSRFTSPPSNGFPTFRDVKRRKKGKKNLRGGNFLTKEGRGRFQRMGKTG